MNKTHPVETIVLNQEEFRDRVLACWIGKNVGGTLGAPFEWKRQINQVDFYTQDLRGEPLPNDDLDIQLLWLIALEEKGLRLDSQSLAEYWNVCVTPHWSEYGVAGQNLRLGIPPPLSGSFNNTWKHSCGAWIRSEIWACVTPGLPERAAQYAMKDAVIDHGDGEGTYAEVFFASLESAAFVIRDLRTIVDIGLSFIPLKCGTARAVRSALECVDQKLAWQQAREEILRKHRGYGPWPSEEDKQKGLQDGEIGYDSPLNVALTIFSLFNGGTNFDRVVCTAVNCGEDTDCTAATAGAIFGILYGSEAIPKRWLEPIGRRIITACLNKGELGFYGDQIPQDIDELTERTVRIARQVLADGRNCPVVLSHAETSLEFANPEKLQGRENGAELYERLRGPTFTSECFEVWTDYGTEPTVCSRTAKTIRLTIHNLVKTQVNVRLRWLSAEGWLIKPNVQAFLFMETFERATLEFEITIDEPRELLNRAMVELTIPGRSFAMGVPIGLIHKDQGAISILK